MELNIPDDSQNLAKRVEKTYQLENCHFRDLYFKNPAIKLCYVCFILQKLE
jgi:hypothetical protein